MLTFRSLASGSSGNAFLLQTPRSKLLFDAGIRLPKLSGFLRDEGVDPSTLTAVLISHEHTDHCLAVRDLAETHGVPIWSNADVLKAAKLCDLTQATIIDMDESVRFGDVEVTCFPVSHDAVRPMGFFVRTQGKTIVIATDLGQPTNAVLDVVSQGDLVVLEANHDLRMLQDGRYPPYLRHRVAGPKGHLSNDQAGSVLRDHLKGPDVDIWLAHLSRENNSPALATRSVRRLLAMVGLDAAGVQVAARDRPSLRWSGVPRPRQLPLFSLSGN